MKTNRIRKTLLVALLCTLVLSVVQVGFAAKHPRKYTETITTKGGKTITFDMVLIPAGTFMMGSPDGEAGRKDHEGPQHPVKLDSYYLCTTEATIELFMAYYEETVTAKKDFEQAQEEKKKAQSAVGVDAVTGPTPVYGDITMGYSPKHPALGITWHNAKTFCAWLAKKTGKPYRLPTEAEWEYACRAGSKEAYSFGGDPKGLGEYAWFEDNSDTEIHAVAQKKPNAWGLYDMAGNVNEWVFDFYSPTAYAERAKQSPAVNPQGPKAGEVHVARGGDYGVPAEEQRCAVRNFEEDWWRFGDPQIPKSIWWMPELDIIGIRVARSLEAEKK